MKSLLPTGEKVRAYSLCYHRHVRLILDMVQYWTLLINKSMHSDDGYWLAASVVLLLSQLTWYFGMHSANSSRIFSPCLASLSYLRHSIIFFMPAKMLWDVVVVKGVKFWSQKRSHTGGVMQRKCSHPNVEIFLGNNSLHTTGIIVLVFRIKKL